MSSVTVGEMDRGQKDEQTDTVGFQEGISQVPTQPLARSEVKSEATPWLLARDPMPYGNVRGGAE